MERLSWTAKNLDDTLRLGKCLADSIRRYLGDSTSLVICLDGSLGAGKTTLTSSICQTLGVKDELVSSPTFSLQNIYETELGQKKITISHFDFYRIADEDELMELGFEESITQPGIHLIEWANRFACMLPNDCLFIEIGHLAENQREFVFQTTQKELVDGIENCLSQN